MGLIPRILLTWRAPGAAVRGMAGLSEPALLALLIGTMAVYFVAQWPVHARAAALDPSIPLGARLGGALMATLFLMPLIVLGVAAVVRLIAGAAGSRLSGQGSRLALIWALAATSPAMLLIGMAQALAGPGPALALLRAGTAVAFLVFWAVGLRALGPGEGRGATKGRA